MQNTHTHTEHTHVGMVVVRVLGQTAEKVSRMFTQNTQNAIWKKMHPSRTHTPHANTVINNNNNIPITAISISSATLPHEIELCVRTQCVAHFVISIPGLEHCSTHTEAPQSSGSSNSSRRKFRPIQATPQTNRTAPFNMHPNPYIGIYMYIIYNTEQRTHAQIYTTPNSTATHNVKPRHQRQANILPAFLCASCPVLPRRIEQCMHAIRQMRRPGIMFIAVPRYMAVVHMRGAFEILDTAAAAVERAAHSARVRCADVERAGAHICLWGLWRRPLSGCGDCCCWLWVRAILALCTCRKCFNEGSFLCDLLCIIAPLLCVNARCHVPSVYALHSSNNNRISAAVNTHAHGIVHVLCML